MMMQTWPSLSRTTSVTNSELLIKPQFLDQFRQRSAKIFGTDLRIHFELILI